MNEAPAWPASLRWTRALAVGATIAIVLLGLAWELWLAPTGRGTLAVKVLPLVLALPGLWRDRLYTYRWTSLLVWLYFAEGAVRATRDRGLGAPLAAVEVMLTLVLFVACGVHIRARLREAAPAVAAAGAGPLP
jgi:uncharacterized membrane protein